MIASGTILIIVASLIFPGVIVMTKAKLEGRKGPRLFQPLFDTWRLFRKGSVYSRTTSPVFQMAPVIYLASVLTAVLLVPFGETQGPLSFEGDFVFFACVLAIGRFFMIIGAMDTGSGFEGMGANREALYSILVEPVFFMLMGSIALLSNGTSFHDIYNHTQPSSLLSYLPVIVSIYLLIHIMLVENSRLPVDDPKTHLELTMVHEVMVLDNSGFDLAIIQLSTGLKFALYSTLIADFFIPSGGGMGAQIGVFLLVQTLSAMVVGFSESFRARNKLAKNPQWILTLSAIAIVLFLTVLIVNHKFIIN